MRIIKESQILSSKEMADSWKARHGADALVQFKQVAVFLEAQGKMNDYFKKVIDHLSK